MASNGANASSDSSSIRHLLSASPCCREYFIPLFRKLCVLGAFDKRLWPPLTTPTALMATTPLSKPMKKTGDSEEGKHGCCEVCKIDCRGYSFCRHVRGKKHRENLRESNKMTSFPLKDIDPVIIQPNDSVEDPNLTNGKVVNPDEGSSTLEEGKSVILEMGKRKGNGSLADGKETDAKRKKMVTEGRPSAPQEYQVAPELHSHLHKQDQVNKPWHQVQHEVLQLLQL
ncbi:hypothetical protein L2E82_46010 [Cichorium intybus]|uniref:Uncharacterized protein n=1 Tax=Cichorium intybus TaxID=13427 RepID=A0ACB8ZV27_CICIN|nr:hypothetical protein L2E82_46010 [Cichorium intybus]